MYIYFFKLSSSQVLGSPLCWSTTLAVWGFFLRSLLWAFGWIQVTESSFPPHREEWVYRTHVSTIEQHDTELSSPWKAWMLQNSKYAFRDLCMRFCIADEEDKSCFHWYPKQIASPLTPPTSMHFWFVLPNDFLKTTISHLEVFNFRKLSSVNFWW